MKYACSACHAVAPRALLICPECGRRNTFREHKSQLQTMGPTEVQEVQAEGGRPEEHRYLTGTREFDRVLGGGLMMGGVYLLSGEPGQGKTTLAHTVAAELADGIEEGEEAKRDPFKALYISGEETAIQIADRGKRICADSKRLKIAVETDIEKIIAMLEEEKPDLAVIDSIQKMRFKREGGTAISIRLITDLLVEVCKRPNHDTVGCLIIICHVTKDGGVAGPMYLEHMVDCVLKFESEGRSQKLRALRALKNRFGETSYVGLFSMGDTGLSSVDDPSLYLLRGRKGPPGSAVGIAMVAAGTGHSSSRPMLVEVQALFGPSVERQARWTTVDGYDEKRLAMVMTLLARTEFQRADKNLRDILMHDVYLNVPASMKLEDQAALDLPVAMAIASAYFNEPLPPGSIFWGEIDLLSNVRYEVEIKARKASAERMKFEKMFYSEEESVLDLKTVLERAFGE